MLRKSIFSAGLLLIIPCLNANAQSEEKDWFYNPFNKDSAHHRPIGTGATYVSENDRVTRDWLASASRFVFNVGIPHGRSVAKNDSKTDPRVTVVQRHDTSGLGLPVAIPLQDGRFETHGDGQWDSEVVIYDRHQDEIFELRKWNWNGGSPQAQRRWRWDIKGLGHGTKQGEALGNSAAGTAGLFGLLRGWEINQPGQKIGHALHMAAARIGDSCPHVLSREVVYPATNRDLGWDDPKNNRGHAPYGALFAIPPEDKGGPNLDSLGLSEPGRRLAEALRDYGVYVVDGVGCGTAAIRVDQHMSESVRQQLLKDSYEIYKHMRMVRNNDGNLPVAGGGTPLAPNTAIDATNIARLLPPSQLRKH
jgi:hypothetical protein